MLDTTFLLFYEMLLTFFPQNLFLTILWPSVCLLHNLPWVQCKPPEVLWQLMKAMTASTEATALT